MNAHPSRFRSASVALYCASVCSLSVASAADAAREIQIVVIGTIEQEDWVEHLLNPAGEAARASVSRSSVFHEAEVLAPRSADDPALSCWVDLRDPLRARIYFRAKNGDRFLLRDLELSGRADDLDREALSEILSTSSAALLDDEQAGLSRAETVELIAHRSEPLRASSPAPPTPTPPPRKHDPTARTFVGAGLFYSGQAFARELPITHGPGLWLSFGRETSTRWLGLWLMGEYRFPETARSETAGVRLESLELGGGLEGGLVLSAGEARREISARLGAGAELAHSSPELGGVSVPLSLATAHWSTLGVFTSSIAAATRLGAGGKLGVRLLVDFLPRVNRYDVETLAGRASLVSPLHVRPGVALELSTR
ncbi:MAG TPA: hypothetical protein VGI10_23145 [Polyangiaceae bacterium]